MVDGGPPKMMSKFLKKMKAFSIDPSELQLIILTHGDFDHVGSAKDIRDITGAKIAIHKNDRVNLEEGIFNWPVGATAWGKFSRALFKPLIKNAMAFPGTKADLILDDGDVALNDYGIEGRIIHTPGHTKGSVSVLLDTGEIFAGCLVHNRLPFSLQPSLPIYAENIHQIKESWKKLIAAGAKMVFPGHGEPFTVELIKKYLN